MAPWSGVLAVADGALCYVGALSDAHGHHHVATQFVRAWAGSFELADGHNNRVVTSAAIIPSGCDHSIRILKPVVSGVLVFVDPQVRSRLTWQNSFAVATTRVSGPRRGRRSVGWNR